jgi:predicted secreted protein
MGWVSGIVVYLMVWWTMLFMVLPWGIQRDTTTGQIGAPLKTHLLKKFIITTGLAFVVWLVIYYITKQADLLSFRDMARDMPM